MSPDNKQVEALTALLEEAGLDVSDLLTAITTLASAKKAAIEKVEKTGGRKNVINKELDYPDETLNLMSITLELMINSLKNSM